MPEFALWWETNNLLFGATHNPWKIGYTPGGSSGGEGAALATGDVAVRGWDRPRRIDTGSRPVFAGWRGLSRRWVEYLIRGSCLRLYFGPYTSGPWRGDVQDVALELVHHGRAPTGRTFTLRRYPFPTTQNLERRLCPSCASGGALPGGTPVEERSPEGRSRSAAKALSGLGHDVEQVEIPGLGDNDAQVISSVVYPVEAKPLLMSIVGGREDELTPLLRKRYIDSPDKTMDEYLEAIFNWESLKWEVGNTSRDMTCSCVQRRLCRHTRRVGRSSKSGGERWGQGTAFGRRCPGTLRVSGDERALRMEQRGYADRGADRGSALRGAHTIEGCEGAGRVPDGQASAGCRHVNRVAVKTGILRGIGATNGGRSHGNAGP